MRFAFVAALVAVALPARAAAQLSPGALSRAHQGLDGATRCTQCHGPSRDAMPRLCLACHREVAMLVSQGRGLHAREGKTSGKSCAACHPEHAGREFELIAWPAGGRERFDHRAAGWPLEGKHAALGCDRCHRADFRNGAVAALSPRRGSAGWMGLETACVSCHQRDDPHGNSLGPRCEKCHNASAWSPAPGFNHASSRYPLTGKHVDVACAKCHLAPALAIAAGPDGKRAPRFRPLEFRECSSCHADPHQGRMSARCTECHVTRGFDVLDRREFNHALTRYPLLGKHREVACEGCHGRDMAQPRPAFGACATCHADRHGGEATLAGVVVDCAACHRVEAFAPATFTIAQHRASRFALAGKHETVACAACHTSTTAPGSTTRVIRLRVSFSSCASCHADPHGSQLGDRRCDQCHTDGGWSDIRFDRADHARTRLPLDGRHAALACFACHARARPGLPAWPTAATIGSAGVMFRIPEVRCAACHTDPHATAGEMPRADTSTACESCHTTTAFSPATIGVESHARFAFPLEGAHRAVPCRDCHTGLPPASAGGSASTLIALAQPVRHIALGAVRGTSCRACHEGPHGSQFDSRSDRGRCDGCHGTDAFTDVTRFDHDRDAAFALKGAHALIPCARCHRTEPAGGTVRVIYRPIPHRCEDCHTARTTRGVQ